MTYTDIDGWCDFEDFYGSMVDRFPGGVFVEVGCYLGRSLCYLGQTVKASGKPIVVVGVEYGKGSGHELDRDFHKEAVDRNGGNLYHELAANVERCDLGDVVTVLNLDSVTAARTFADESVAFCFIDARHDYASVKADITAWLPKVRKGGVIGGHDFFPIPHPPFPGVNEAVTELIPNYHLTSKSCWYYEKV